MDRNRPTKSTKVRKHFAPTSKGCRASINGGASPGGEMLSTGGGAGGPRSWIGWMGWMPGAAEAGAEAWDETRKLMSSLFSGQVVWKPFGIPVGLCLFGEFGELGPTKIHIQWTQHIQIRNTTILRQSKGSLKNQLADCALRPMLFLGPGGPGIQIEIQWAIQNKQNKNKKKKKKHWDWHLVMVKDRKKKTQRLPQPPAVEVQLTPSQSYELNQTLHVVTCFTVEVVKTCQSWYSIHNPLFHFFSHSTRIVVKLWACSRTIEVRTCKMNWSIIGYKTDFLWTFLSLLHNSFQFIQSLFKNAHRFTAQIKNLSQNSGKFSIPKQQTPTAKPPSLRGRPSRWLARDPSRSWNPPNETWKGETWWCSWTFKWKGAICKLESHMGFQIC